MSDSGARNDGTEASEAEQKRRQHFEKARRGVLEYLAASGGLLSLGDLHEFSEKTFFVGHQKFSGLMEELVDGGLVSYDGSTHQVRLEDEGRSFLA